MKVDARNNRYELVSLFGKEVLFTDLRVDRATVPKGMYLYEVRHADEDWCTPCQIGSWIMVNHYGTVISNEPIALTKSPQINNAYRELDGERDWVCQDEHLTLQEYMQIHPPRKEKSKDLER